MKKWFNSASKVLSVLLALILTITPALAISGTYLESEDLFVFYESGDTKVDGYQTVDGTLIFRQYVNGELVQRNTLRPTAPDVIEQEFFGAFKTRAAESSTILISDYITVQFEPAVTPMASAPYQVVGTVSYTTTSTYNGAPFNYGLRCLCQELAIGTTTYTIKSYVGQIVDLVAIVAGAISVPVVIISPFITALLSSLAITVASGMIEEAFSDTVSCNRTDYNWKVTDTTDSGHFRDLTAFGAKYYITDALSDMNGQTYYDGWCPSDWGDAGLGAALHDEMFSYSIYSITGWSTGY